MCHPVFKIAGLSELNELKKRAAFRADTTEKAGAFRADQTLKNGAFRAFNNILPEEKWVLNFFFLVKKKKF